MTVMQRENAISKTSEAHHAEQDALDIFTIAELPDAAIRNMSVDELTRIIHASELPLSIDCSGDGLNLRDQEAFLRLAFLARRTCRHRTLFLELQS